VPLRRVVQKESRARMYLEKNLLSYNIKAVTLKKQKTKKFQKSYTGKKCYSLPPAKQLTV